MRIFISVVLIVAELAAFSVGREAAGQAGERPQASTATTQHRRTGIVKADTKGTTAAKESLKSFLIKFPEHFNAETFTSRATVDIEIFSDGKVGKVTLVKSTEVPSIDQQLQEGVKKWRFRTRSEKQFLYLTLIIEIQ